MIPDEVKSMLKDLYSSAIFKAFLVFLLLVIGVISISVFHFKKDNPIEQTAELAIEEITGLEMDLTPGE